MNAEFLFVNHFCFPAHIQVHFTDRSFGQRHIGCVAGEQIGCTPMHVPTGSSRASLGTVKPAVNAADIATANNANFVFMNEV